MSTANALADRGQAQPAVSMIQHGNVYGGRAPAMLGIGFVGTIITTFLIVGRLALRIKKGKAERWHDLSMWLALISYLLAVVATCLLAKAVSHGFGNHTANLSLPNLIQATKYMWIAIAPATLSSGVSKASVAAFLLALQGKAPMHKNWAFFLYFVMLSNVVLSIAAVSVTVFQCNPPEAVWNPTVQAETCYGREKVFGPLGLVHASWTALSDFVLAVYPIYIVYKLRIAIGIKIYLCMVMGLGLVACAFSFVKLHQFNVLIKQRPADPMWETPILVIWGWVELWLVLIALSVPPIWPLARPCLSRLTCTLNDGQRRTGRSGYRDVSRESKPFQLASTSKLRCGITETKDVVVHTEAHSTQDLCPGHNQELEV